MVDTGIGVASLRDAAHDLFGHDLMAVATHAHRDHVGGLHEFTDRAIHAAEAERLAGPDESLELDVTTYDDAALDAMATWGYDIRPGLLTAIPHRGFDLRAQVMRSAPATTLLVEGDVIDVGDRAFEVLHLPGHSPGSIGLWDARHGLLFSGDAVYDGPLLDEIAGSDVDAYVDTMRRLLELPVETVHGGHGVSMDRRRFRDVVRAYLDRRAVA